MLRGYNPLVQALLGTIFTWGLTAAGSALVFVFKSEQKKVLDGSLGFAAGVMLAASFWSLLDPALSISESQYGGSVFSLVPVAVGFLLGALFVYAIDFMLPSMTPSSINKTLNVGDGLSQISDIPTIKISSNYSHSASSSQYLQDNLRKRGLKRDESLSNEFCIPDTKKNIDENSWRRIVLLVIAITVHNIPEGLAVGVGFGAIGKSKATFEGARNLALGIGIQNFPEGLAVSLPLRGCGFSLWKSFWWGQLSGLVEPVAGVAGAAMVTLMEPALPYALSFAAGAMVFVVLDDIVPEAQTSGNGKLASWTAIFGFVLMMTLDVGLS